MQEFKTFYELMRFLKKSFPISYPIHVRRVNLSDEIDGDCVLLKNKFIVRIKKNLPEYYAIDVLLHEFSHCLSWNQEEDVHGACWGNAYSIVYRKYLEWLESPPIKN